MKKFFLLLFLFQGMVALSQKDTLKKGQERRKLIPDISTVEKIKKMQDSAAPVIPVHVSPYTGEDLSRNMANILALQKEQKARQKKAAMIRIGIGVTFLAVLIIGLSRRRRKK